ncbi:MAG: gamma-glutamyltransferase [Solirubrobacteraceae bacterium]|nr:gamma-glutamyltransferase [Solirubrobacteraceae bacterium]
MSSRGICAAGHPLTAEAGARVLREGGNAVDAALGAMLTSWVAEPLLTGPGAGGYLLVAGADTEPALLDFFVEAPSGDPASRGELLAVDVSFGDAMQVFHVGAASCGAYGTPAGVVAASERWGGVPLDRLAAPAVQLARDGVAVNRQQAYIFEILAGILASDPTAMAEFAPDGRGLREGDTFRSEALAGTIERLGAEGAAPFYTGDVADAIVSYLGERGGALTREDLAGYAAIEREPVRVGYRGHEVLTNPPPSAGGVLIALALALLDRGDAPPSTEEILAVMETVQAERTAEFLDGLAEPGYGQRLIASRLGSTTHISVVDADGLACAVTCTNGEGCGLVVPGTGIHVNNIMGEEDLSPLGFHTAPPGRRMPSMMAPTAVLDAAGELELVLGSAGSNRIRSAILQTILGVLDHGLSAGDAVAAPRVHFEAGTVYAEPGVPLDDLVASGREVVTFRDRNLFFGGVQAVERTRGHDGARVLRGAGDPRRGGAVAAA